jgi:hypothetical protein
VQNIELLIAHVAPKPRIALALLNFKQTQRRFRSRLAYRMRAPFSHDTYFARPAYPY